MSISNICTIELNIMDLDFLLYTLEQAHRKAYESCRVLADFDTDSSFIQKQIEYMNEINNFLQKFVEPIRKFGESYNSEVRDTLNKYIALRGTHAQLVNELKDLANTINLKKYGTVLY